MRNYLNNTPSESSKALGYIGWSGLVISLILMTYSMIKSTLAMDILVSDYDQYRHIMDTTREMFLASAIMMVASMTAVFASNN